MNTEFSVGILNPRPSPLELTRISPRLGADAGLLGFSINLHGDLYRFICVLIRTYMNYMYCNKTGCHGAVRVHLCSTGHYVGALRSS